MPETPPPPPYGSYDQWGHQHYWRGGYRGRRFRGRGPLRRTRQDRMLGGVAAGLSRRLCIDVTLVRIALVLGTLASGFAIGAYVVAWLVLPLDEDRETIASRARHDWRGIVLALAFLPALALILLVASESGAGWLDTAAWPTFVAAAGLVLIWRNEDADERENIRRVLRPLARLGLTGEKSWSLLGLRLLVGVGLCSAGLLVLAAGHPNGAGVRLLGGTVLVIGAFVVVFGPWWLHIFRDLVDERQARALAEERAEMAARIHDSVLQTLALVQRHSDDPHEVVQLARAQERELRSWLFGGRVPGALGDEDSTLAEAVLRIERDVEASHGVPIEAVTVGDCELDDGLRSLVEAGREATVNAAKWSGAPVISLFIEVENELVRIWVRDRGVGFEVEDVAPDRRGLTESIEGRMARHGGTAHIRSSPGGGTEVELIMPRDDARRRKVGQK